jgi:hypothetical protein
MLMHKVAEASRHHFALFLESSGYCQALVQPKRVGTAERAQNEAIARVPTRFIETDSALIARELLA